jgi:hypothetical protein
MSIRGRNASGLINQKLSASYAGNATAVSAIFAALRTSLFLKEAGVTIVTGGGAGTNAITVGTIRPQLYAQIPGAGAALVASIDGTLGSGGEVAAGASVGTEYTSRDGTLKFADAYANASDRIFPKGTKFSVAQQGNSAGSANDAFVAYMQLEEAGAPPA